MKKRRIQIVEICWDDIAGYGPQWKTADEVADCRHVECRTVGFLWEKGTKNLKVVGTVTEDCGVGDINVIPVGVVRKMTVLSTVTIPVNGESSLTPKRQGKTPRRC